MSALTIVKRFCKECGADRIPPNKCAEVEFHTYYGLLIFTIQETHRFRLPPTQARELLWKLHKFNLIWGLFAYGALVIPLLSYVNYLMQKSKISKQEMQLKKRSAARSPST